jgi:putative transposase
VARLPRNETVGIHHVFARGNDRIRLFRDDADKVGYLAILRSVVMRMRWSCLAYCLMHNHVHLLIGTETPNLGAGMGRLHGLYARAFNDRDGRSGHLFQGRYGSVLQSTDEQLWHAIAYIARNPVKSGLCGSPEDWRWSSHAHVLAGTSPPWMDETRLLRCFEGAGGDPRRLYVELVG